MKYDKEIQKKGADNIRILSAAMVEQANSGHPGGAMGGADYIQLLFSEYLVYDPKDPQWFFRDRFFLDPGLYGISDSFQLIIIHFKLMQNRFLR